MMEAYDVVVIGAGNGGLTAAATLAKKGVKVLVLERHNIPGGCGTSFCRGRFEFEVALHQLSGMGTSDKPGPLRSQLDKLGVLDKLEFVQMKDLYRVVIPGEVDITLKPDWSELVAELQKHFPDERESIQNYYDLMRNLFTEVIGAFYLGDPEVSREKYPLYFTYALRNLQGVLDEFFSDPILKFVVSPYWSYIGVPPRLMSVVDMAALLFGFVEFKPYHLKGGSQAMSNAIADSIISNGGTIRFNCAARRIIVENGEVRGVITEDGEEISTRFVVSNASKITTFLEMIEDNQIPEEVITELRQSSIAISAFTVYMGLDCEPEEAGISESTTFICGSTDMERAYEQMKSIEIGQNDAMLLSCYDIITPDFSAAGTSQVALVTLKYGEPWLSVPPGRYVKEKYRIADNMLKKAERVFPDLRGHIEEIEVATPLTHLRYLGHPRGSVYGFEQLVKDSNLFIPTRSLIRGLYGAGAWVGYPGFQPTLESGVSAARALLSDMNA
jgi:phytoene dehydrogenase-like protein